MRKRPRGEGAEVEARWRRRWEAEDGGPGKVGVVWAVGGTKIEEGEETKRD